MKKLILILMSLCLLLSATVLSVSAGNTWMDPGLSEEEGGFIDANRNGEYKEVAYRFAIREGGQLVAIYAALLGSDKNADENGPATFDFAIYNWNEDYATTVQQEPVQFRDNIQYSLEDLSANLYYMFNLEQPLGAGQYLVVLSDFDVAWALRSYLFQPSLRGEFLTYINGEEYDNTMWWSLHFADGNDWWGDTALDAKPEESTTPESVTTDLQDETTEPVTTPEVTDKPADSNTSATTEPTDSTVTTDDAKEEPATSPVGLIVGVVAAVIVVAVIVVIVLKKRK